MQLLAFPSVVITEYAATAALPFILRRILLIRKTSTTPVPMLNTEGIALLNSSATFERLTFWNLNLKMLLLEKKYQIATRRAT